MNIDSVSTKEIIQALASLPNLTKRLIDNDNEYNILIREILKYNYNEGPYPPTRKELEKLMNITPSKFKSLLVKLYNDFKMLLQQEDIALVVNELIYEIYVRHFDRSFMFRCKLPMELKIGENIQLHFLKPIVGCTNFYVQKIYHEITDNKQIINVWLKGGMSNWHEMYLDDKAKSEYKYDWKLGIREKE